MTFRELLVKQYAYDIYVYGTKRLSTINQSYVTDVKTYAAANFKREDIDVALAKGYITQTEYDETIALMPVV